MTTSGWIGVDLDELWLNTMDGKEWKILENHPCNGKQSIDWLYQGIAVKIFTARAGIPEQIPFIKKWLIDNGLPELEVTNVKDFAMIELWDDRCKQVIINTGELVE